MVNLIAEMIEPYSGKIFAPCCGSGGMFVQSVKPLHARAETRRALGPQRKPLPAHIQKLFLDDFHFDEKMGWISERWRVEPVYDVAEFINGAAFKSADFCSKDDGLPVVKIAELKNGISAQTKFTDNIIDKKYSIDDEKMLFSWSGSPDTSIDTFIWSGEPGWLNQHVFKVALHDAKDRSFVYCMLKYLKPVFIEIARDKQTTGLGHVTAKDRKRLYVLKPSHAMLENLDSFVKLLMSRSFGNQIKNHRLAKLRDTLLPKLLSGELRIPDAEQLAAGSL